MTWTHTSPNMDQCRLPNAEPRQLSCEEIGGVLFYVLTARISSEWIGAFYEKALERALTVSSILYVHHASVINRQ